MLCESSVASLVLPLQSRDVWRDGEGDGVLSELVSLPVHALGAGCHPALLSPPACLSSLVLWGLLARLLMSPDGCKKQRCC